jgi:hypothetical protein
MALLTKIEFSGVIGRTFSDRPINAIALHLSRSRTGKEPNRDLELIDKSKENVLFVSYLIPVDYLSINLAVGYLLNLVGGYVRRDAEVLSLLETKTVWLVPMVNVDAAEYLLQYLQKRNTVTFIYKNRKNDSYTNDAKCGANGQGVNLNKNFKVGFNYEGDLNGEDYPCNTNYGGVSPLSEQETKSIDELISKINPNLEVTLFSEHKLITYPNLDLLEKRDEFIDLFKKFITKLSLYNDFKEGMSVYDPIKHNKPTLYSKGGNIDEYLLYHKSSLGFTRTVLSELLRGLGRAGVQRVPSQEGHDRQNRNAKPAQPQLPFLHRRRIRQVLTLQTASTICRRPTAYQMTAASTS